MRDIVTILVCPACKGQLEADDGVLHLTCRPCRLVFPVRDGIPVLLVAEAAHLQDHGAGDKGP